jgi:hypothetical protein
MGGLSNGLVWDGSNWVPERGTYSSTPTHSTVTLSTSSATVVSANTSRKSLIITNTSSSNRVTLNFGGTAVIDTGVTIMPGGAFNMSTLDYFTGAINGIAAGAGTILAIAEF